MAYVHHNSGRGAVSDDLQRITGHRPTDLGETRGNYGPYHRDERPSFRSEGSSSRHAGQACGRGKPDDAERWPDTQFRTPDQIRETRHMDGYQRLSHSDRNGEAMANGSGDNLSSNRSQPSSGRVESSHVEIIRRRAEIANLLLWSFCFLWIGVAIARIVTAEVPTEQTIPSYVAQDRLLAQ